MAPDAGPVCQSMQVCFRSNSNFIIIFFLTCKFTATYFGWQWALFRASLDRMQIEKIGIGQLHWSTANYAPLQEMALWDGLVAMYDQVTIISAQMGSTFSSLNLNSEYLKPYVSFWCCTHKVGELQGLVQAVGVSNYGPKQLVKIHDYLKDRGVPLCSAQVFGMNKLTNHHVLDQWFKAKHLRRIRIRVRSYISWSGKRNIPYKGVEIFL